MEQSILIPKQYYKVVVRCFTFNQSKYIEDALNGFVRQQTVFPYVCIIVDDCSTDGEQDVIKSFLNKGFEMSQSEEFETDYAYITKVPHKTNLNCTFVVFLLKYNHYSKKQKKGPYFQQWREVCSYEALCEGDDYWIDPTKLQKQVEWLDVHSDYTMCCSDAIIKLPDRELDWSRYKEDTDIPAKDMIEGGGLFVQTTTIVYRVELLEYLKQDFIRQCSVGDFPLQLMSVIRGKVRYMSDKTSVYRYQSEGSWSFNEKKGNVDRLIRGWQSVIRMLDGFDIYTDGIYHEYFTNRKISYLEKKISQYKKHKNIIINEFSEVIKKFPLEKRFDFFCIKKNLGFVVRIKNKMIHLLTF